MDNDVINIGYLVTLTGYASSGVWLGCYLILYLYRTTFCRALFLRPISTGIPFVTESLGCQLWPIEERTFFNQQVLYSRLQYIILFMYYSFSIWYKKWRARIFSCLSLGCKLLSYKCKRRNWIRGIFLYLHALYITRTSLLPYQVIFITRTSLLLYQVILRL